MTIGSGRRHSQGGGGLQPAQSGAGGGCRMEAGVRRSGGQEVRRSLPGAGVEGGHQHQQEDEAAQHGHQAEPGQRGAEAGAGAGGHQLQLAPV